VKAAVCREFGKPLRIEDVAVALPGEGEISVQVKACGICQSDIHFIAGAWGGELPAVYGHEAAGIVTDVGPGVAAPRIGDRVVVTLIRSCGRCWFCRQGTPVFCETRFRLDEKSPLQGSDGSITQGLRTAGFAEQVLVDASQAVTIADDVPFESAALLACAVITGFGAVVNTAAVEPGRSVVVIGTGGVGLNAVQGAALSGAHPVIAVDLSTTKLAAARAFGASHALNPHDQSVESTVAGLTGGRRADYVFVTAGTRPAVDQGLRIVRRGGALVMVGIPPTGVTSAVDLGAIANDGVRILGCKMGGARVQVDVPALVRLYRQGRLKLDELVTRRYPLAQINDAIASATQGDALRNVIVF
jgi:S-(hydroxymethyl)glutathione dehydrogenase / alcohol dehydrogenase